MKLAVPINPFGSSMPNIEDYISKYMEIQRKPIADLNRTKDSFKAQDAVFRDLNASLLALKDAAEALLASAADPIYDKITAISSKPDVLSAEVSGTPIETTHNIFVSRLASQDVVVSNQLVSSDASLWTTTGTKTFTITVGGVSKDVSVSVTAGETNATVLAKMAEAINAAGAGVRAAVVSQTAGESRLVITSSTTGSASAITLSESGTGNDLLSLTGTNSGSLASATSGGYLVERNQLDSQFTVDGLAFTRSSNTITDAIAGVTLKLKAAQATGDSPATIEVRTDTNAIKDKIKAFINQYNAALRYIKNKALIDADAGVRGPLAGNYTYTSIEPALRRAAQEAVAGLPAGAPTQLFQIGIKADDTGALSIADEAKLDDYLTTSPQAVADLLGSTTGVAQKVLDLVSPYVKDLVGIIARDRDSISGKIRNIDQRIQGIEERLAQQEQALRAQLSTMMRLMAELNAQRSTLGQFMNIGSGFLA